MNIKDTFCCNASSLLFEVSIHKMKFEINMDFSKEIYIFLVYPNFWIALYFCLCVTVISRLEFQKCGIQIFGMLFSNLLFRGKLSMRFHFSGIIIKKCAKTTIFFFFVKIYLKKLKTLMWHKPNLHCSFGSMHLLNILFT